MAGEAPYEDLAYLDHPVLDCSAHGDVRGILAASPDQSGRSPDTISDHVVSRGPRPRRCLVADVAAVLPIPRSDGAGAYRKAGWLHHHVRGHPRAVRWLLPPHDCRTGERALRRDSGHHCRSRVAHDCDRDLYLRV